jgi:hypothetical protein
MLFSEHIINLPHHPLGPLKSGGQLDLSQYTDSVAEPVPSTVAKTYHQRGPLQQFRFVESTALASRTSSMTPMASPV